MLKNCLLDSEKFNFRVKYPDALIKLIALGLVNFEVWYFMSEERSASMHDLLCERKHVDLIPFARRGDNGDIACLQREGGEKVFLLRECSYLGYQIYGEFTSVWDWFRYAIEIMIAY